MNERVSERASFQLPASNPSWEPSYLRLHRSGELAARARAALDALQSCDICPRVCGVDRTAGGRGACGVGIEPVIAVVERPHVGGAADHRHARVGHDLLLRLHGQVHLLPELPHQPVSPRQHGEHRAFRRDDARAARPRRPQHQLRHPHPLRARRSWPRWMLPRGKACACRSSTTPAATTRSRRCACWRTWLTSGCRTPSTPTTRPPAASPASRATSRTTGRRSGKSSARSATS